jgi:predicted nucleotidyltransferase component of viral defense system
MNDSLRSLIKAYELRSSRDYENALKEVVQEIALLGLWRAKFFEYAAFYGGSALRILYGLDRFSEDLDFSLLKRDPRFKLDRFLSAITTELQSFGFDVTIESVTKSIETPVQSAFIKANTRKNMLVIRAPNEFLERMHREKVIKVKIEIDIDPPGDFQTEARIRLLPIPYSVLSYKLCDLFAGKVHALIYRNRQQYIKGRDWYDLVWFVGHSVPVRLAHLKARLVQTRTWKTDADLSKENVLTLLNGIIGRTDFKAARADVIRFVKDPAVLDLWSKDFFLEVVSRITSG